MRSAFFCAVSSLSLLAGTFTPAAAETNAPPGFTRTPTLYTVGYSHLDTEWRWSYPQVIRQFIPNTVRQNEPLFEQFPHYVFNWTGANRYRMIQEYYPEDFEKVRKWVADGRWWPGGCSWEENDPNVPSAESLIRQMLLGHRFFKREFGKESMEYTLPDSFGFPASLPSIIHHCGLRGFVTQKLTWGSAVGIPFNVGYWEGPDGESVLAAINPGAYDGKVTNNWSESSKWKNRIDTNGAASGLFVDYAYYGVGDRGGAPDKRSVQFIEDAIASSGPVRVISARSDQMFNDLAGVSTARLPRYKGDFLLTWHSGGTLSSQAYMKRWNRENELLADAAERASVAAHLLGAAPYPREKLNRAWGLVLGGQFHDILPGTCIPKAYEYAWNDQVIALNSFAEVLLDGVGAVARGLDTRVEGVPLVVFNPLSVAREDVVEAELDLPGVMDGLQVFDGAKKPVPTQMLDTDGNRCRFLFLAKVPSVGFAVFSVFKATAKAPASPLAITTRSLDNARYRVTLNEAGDIANIFDKAAQHVLLREPARLAFQTENPPLSPAWDMVWSDRTNAPRSYLGGPAKFRIVEQGPVRLALEVERQGENSIFIQTIRLAAGEAGDRVEVFNHVDWQSKACSLKAVFPLTVANPLATYNQDLGKIQRANNDPKKYEVPHHQWLDLTDASGKYGVTILSPAKYGSDKPSDNTVRLTLLYTPGTQKRYIEQRSQDWGRQEFVYGLYGHKSGWQQGGSDWQSERLSQPLIAFRTAPHDGKLGRSFSLLQVDSEDVIVRALKLAEDGDEVIVRLQELNGTGVKGVKVTAATAIRNAFETTGLEKPLQLLSAGEPLRLDFKRYQLRTLALTLKAPAGRLLPPAPVPVDLPFNLDVFSSNDARADGDADGAGATIPAEMIGDTVVSEGITFKIGPRAKGQTNAVSCQGQSVRLPGDFNRLYVLAMSVNGDAGATFMVDGRPSWVGVQDWTGYIGQWDNRVFEGTVSEMNYGFTNRVTRITPGFIKRAPLAWFCSHRHLADDTEAFYSYSYLFKYGLELAPGAKTLTLPNDPRIRVLAVTAARNDNDAVEPLRPLYDDFTGRPPVQLRGDGDGPSAINFEAGHTAPEIQN